MSESVQVIDEAQEFKKDAISHYLSNAGKDKLGVDYNIISVFGSQSSGKSTLLNKLFHTQFDVMNEVKRQQTTKGIWLSYAPQIESRTGPSQPENTIFIMDVEGSDGRERGEDQDFERKAALFALSTSQILIVNIWEHQIGLYQGANMGLLKTVFEVNLSLFGNQNHKVLLLFVIRDHIGTTPIENLSRTLIDDLSKMWDTLNKPKTVDPNINLLDLFDLKFITLSHKILQPEKFDQDVAALGDRLVEKGNKEYLFKQEYKQNLPIDGWTLYAENCWHQIQSNKDLDLPTQQILVSRFRCEEISKNSIAIFQTRYLEIFNKGFTFDADVNIAEHFLELRDVALNDYDSSASHYNKAVYESKRESLLLNVYTKLSNTYNEYVKFLKDFYLTEFVSQFDDKSNKKLSFLEKKRQFGDTVLENFTSKIEAVSSIDKEIFNSDRDIQEFQSSLTKETETLKKKEVESLITKAKKKFGSSIKSIINQAINNEPDENLWDNILNSFNELLAGFLAKYQTEENLYDFKLGSSEDETKEITTRIQKIAWLEFDHFVHEIFSEDNAVQILRRKFEDYFTYDENSIPRNWKTEVEINNVYRDSIQKTLKLLPLFSTATLSNDTEILPDIPIHETAEWSDDDDEVEELPHRFAHILNASQQLKVRKQFLKHAEISYKDATRSVISNNTSIPPFIYVILVILGWNEFMAVLRNPLLLILVILFGTGLFFVHQLNLWGPAFTTLNLLTGQVRGTLIQLLDDGNRAGHDVAVTSPLVESDALEDSSNEKKQN